MDKKIFMTTSYPFWVPKDTDALFALFFDNLATTLVVTEALLSREGFEDIVYQRILPGLGISLIWGNIYYAWMARRLATKEDRSDVTAQPYGINTPGAFTKLFLIVLPVYDNNVGELGPKKAAELAWEVAIAANFMSALLEISGSIIGPTVRKCVPPAALLSTLGGIGIAWLALNPLIAMSEMPMCSYLPFAFVVLGFFSKVDFRVPPSVLAVLSGSIMAWAVGHKDGSEVTDALDYVGNTGLTFPLVKLFKAFPDAYKYITVIIPVAMTNFVGTIECVESASIAGDNYNLRESMLVDGIGTLLGACFGSVFGTTVYIGHPAYKSMGARQGYSVVNAILIAILYFTGLVAPLFAIIELESVHPIIIFVGLMIACQAIEISHESHYPAVIVGFLPAICDWANTNLSIPSWGSMSNDGLGALANRSLMNSLVLSSLFVHLIDRNFREGAAWCFVGMILSFFGVIHAEDLEVMHEKDDLGWRFTVSYAMIAVLSLVLHVCQNRGHIESPANHSQEIAERRRSSLTVIGGAESARIMHLNNKVTMPNQVDTWTTKLELPEANKDTSDVLNPIGS